MSKIYLNLINFISIELFSFVEFKITHMIQKRMSYNVLDYKSIYTKKATYTSTRVIYT